MSHGKTNLNYKTMAMDSLQGTVTRGNKRKKGQSCWEKQVVPVTLRHKYYLNEGGNLFFY